MNTEAGFLRAIIAEPDSDDLRLIFADWLSDHDQEKRSEFIRVQCELENLLVGVAPRHWNSLDTILDPQDADQQTWKHKIWALRERMNKLWGNYSTYGSIHYYFHSLMPEGFGCAIIPHHDFTIAGGPFLTVRRGFLHTVTCTTGQWYRFGRRLCEAGPIQRVEVTDKIPLDGLGGFRFTFCSGANFEHWLPGWIRRHWAKKAELYQHFYYPAKAEALGALSQALLNFGRARAKQIRWCVRG